MLAAVREEPTLWQLGQAAGTAVGIAVQYGGDIALQDVRVYAIKKDLMKQKAYNQWPPTANLDCNSQFVI